MRDGLHYAEWVEKNAPGLKDFEFKFLDRGMLKEHIQGVNISVTLKVRLFVLIDKMVQVETHRIKKMKRHWRADS